MWATCDADEAAWQDAPLGVDAAETVQRAGVTHADRVASTWTVFLEDVDHPHRNRTLRTRFDDALARARAFGAVEAYIWSPADSGRSGYVRSSLADARILD